MSQSEVTIHVQQDTPNQYTVRTNQLGEIGSALRGEGNFSITRSVLRPAFVSFVTAIATVIITVLPQYISWIYLGDLQHATDRAQKALSILQSANSAVVQRWQVTNDFFETLAHPIAQPADATNNLYQAALELQKDRWVAYYNEKKTWAVNYNTILTNINYELDEPVFPIVSPDQKFGAMSEKIAKIDCLKSLSLPDQVQSTGYSRYSLKTQFAVISHCLDQSDNYFGLPQTVASGSLTQSDVTNTNNLLNNVNAMSDTFRCYATQRVQFYFVQKENVRLTVLRLFLHASAPNANYDFSGDDKYCPS